MPSVTVPSPLGPLTLVSEGGALTFLGFDCQAVPGPSEDRADAVLREATRQLEEWFAGRRQAFELPLAPQGTDFRKAVWRELQRIPYGEWRSYGQVARALGRPGASRAVGLANGRNPLAIVIPCHRVLGSGGHLVGYGGGLDRKGWLLRHEAGVLGAAALAVPVR